MPAKKTRAQFIADARSKYGDDYDYSRVEYVDSKTRITIFCRRHQRWFDDATPNTHLSKHKSCKHCEFERRSAVRHSNTREFIEKAIKKHGATYGYDRVDYQGNKKYVDIWCNKCADYFPQSPNSHLNGHGCDTCGQKRASYNRRLGKAKWVERCITMHGLKYDYSLVPDDLMVTGDKVKIVCPVDDHPPFEQDANNHQWGSGCSRCSKNFRYDTESYIAAAKKKYGDKYDYSATEYLGCDYYVVVRCIEHDHEFSLLAYSHLYGSGCRICGGNQPLDTESFVAKAQLVHGHKYDYRETVYGKNNKEKVSILCPLHQRPFTPKAIDHLNGSGCPLCLNKGEALVGELLSKAGVDFKSQHSIRFDDTVRIYDFLLPGYGLLIERDGEQHYPQAWGYKRPPWNTQSTYDDVKNNDELKTQLATRQGLRLARIPYWLDNRDVELEVQNILSGKPTYPDVPDPNQEQTKPKPRILQIR